MSGWHRLLAIGREAAQVKEDEESSPPQACPNDGTPLRANGRGVLFCLWGCEYRWPS